MFPAELVSLEGIDNCRKIKGLKLFRSARPDEATDDDITKLIFHNIKTIIDFRDSTEVLKQDMSARVQVYYHEYVSEKHTFKQAPLSDEARGKPDDYRHYFIPMAHGTSYKMALIKRASLSTKLRLAAYAISDKFHGTIELHHYAAQELINPYGLLGLYKDLVTYSGQELAKGSV